MSFPGFGEKAAKAHARGMERSAETVSRGVNRAAETLARGAENSMRLTVIPKVLLAACVLALSVWAAVTIHRGGYRNALRPSLIARCAHPPFPIPFPQSSFGAIRPANQRRHDAREQANQAGQIGKPILLPAAVLPALERAPLASGTHFSLQRWGGATPSQW